MKTKKRNWNFLIGKTQVPVNWFHLHHFLIKFNILTTVRTILNRAHKSFVLRDIANRSCNAPS